MLGFQEGAARYSEELSAIVLVPAAARLGDVRANRRRGSDQLRAYGFAVEQWPVLDGRMQLVGEGDGLLVGDQALNVRGHTRLRLRSPHFRPPPRTNSSNEGMG